MTFNIDKTWCRNAGAREDGLDIGAGVIAADPMFTHEGSTDDNPEASRLALGRFINLMRRDQGSSIEAFAEKADIEIGELLSSTLYKKNAHVHVQKIPFVAISSRACSRGKMIPPKSPTSYQRSR